MRFRYSLNITRELNDIVPVVAAKRRRRQTSNDLVAPVQN
jgi:hypothetical protein